MASSYYTRSKAITGYKAAGVLPFALHGSQILVLLGAELTKTGPKGKFLKFLWRDFGGARESADVDSAATAAREFAEETLGLFGGCSVDQSSVDTCSQLFAQRLRDSQLAVKVVHTLKKGEYHMFLTQTCFMAPLMFRLSTQQNCATGAVPGGEKTAFAWVPLADLLQAVHTEQRRYRLTCKSSVCGGRGTPPPCGHGQREFHLHPCFASSLRLAQDCGLSDLLSKAEALPLPPPAPFPILAPPSGALQEAAPEQHAVPHDPDELAACDSTDSHCSAQGPTPDHMTYWLAQEAIALKLSEHTVAPQGGASAIAMAEAAYVSHQAEPAASHASCASIAEEQLDATSGSCNFASIGEALAVAASARAAAIAAAVAAATHPMAVQGGSGSHRRRRSRKQRQQTRQRQLRQREQQQVLLPHAAATKEPLDAMCCHVGESSISVQCDDHHHQQEHEPQQERCADSPACGMQSSHMQRGQHSAPRQVNPPLQPSTMRGHWEVAQGSLEQLLGCNASPRKRIRLD